MRRIEIKPQPLRDDATTGNHAVIASLDFVRLDGIRDAGELIEIAGVVLRLAGNRRYVVDCIYTADKLTPDGWDALFKSSPGFAAG